MTNLSYPHIRSSWNSDRVAACHIAKPHTARAARKRHLYVQYLDNEVRVCGARGKAHFAIKLDQKITDAFVRDDLLIVTTADDCERHYDVQTSKLLAEIWPTPPEGDSVRVAFALAA